MPGLREWGSGLEALTESYFKYVEGCVVEVGRVFQRTKDINHPTLPRSTYPFDIDLFAVNPAKRSVILISCSQRWSKSTEKTMEEFQHYENFVRRSKELGWGNKVAVAKKITCVRISSKRRQELLKKGIEVVEAKFMLQKLLHAIRRSRAEERKYVHREPLLWLLQTLDEIEELQL